MDLFSLRVIKKEGISAETVKNALVNGKDYKKIEIVGFSASELFSDEMLKQYAFKLTHFYFEPPREVTSADEDCLRKFLDPQMDTIKSLKLLEWHGVDVIQTIFRMRKIEKLTIKPKDNLTWNGVNLEKNFSLRIFELAESKQLPESFIATLFGSMPELRVVLVVSGQAKVDENFFRFTPYMRNVYFNVKLPGDIIFTSGWMESEKQFLRNEMCYDLEDEFCQELISGVEKPGIDFTTVVHTTKPILLTNNSVPIKFEEIAMITTEGNYRYRIHEPNRVVRTCGF